MIIGHYKLSSVYIEKMESKLSRGKSVLESVVAVVTKDSIMTHFLYLIEEKRICLQNLLMPQSAKSNMLRIKGSFRYTLQVWEIRRCGRKWNSVYQHVPIESSNLRSSITCEKCSCKGSYVLQSLFEQWLTKMSQFLKKMYEKVFQVNVELTWKFNMLNVQYPHQEVFSYTAVCL